MSEKVVKQGEAIDCNIRQELAGVADAVTERRKHNPAGKTKDK